MKKVLIISFLIFTILISFLNTSYAAVAVTGDKIFDFFKKLTTESLTIKYSGENGSSSQSFDFSELTLTHEDNKIIFTAPDNSVSFELNYTITNNNVTFSSGRTINTESIENSDTAMNELFFALYVNSIITSSFLSISEIQGTDLNVAYAYYSSKHQESTDENQSSITDDVFKYSSNTTDTSYELNLSINLDNWSKVNTANPAGYTVTFVPITDISTNDSDSSTTTDNNTASNNSTALQESVNKVTNSTNKLPQTGNFFNIKNALFLLILACVVGIVFLLVPNVKYRNINKK